MSKTNSLAVRLECWKCHACKICNTCPFIIYNRMHSQILRTFEVRFTLSSSLMDGAQISFMVERIFIDSDPTEISNLRRDGILSWYILLLCFYLWQSCFEFIILSQEERMGTAPSPLISKALQNNLYFVLSSGTTFQVQLPLSNTEKQAAQWRASGILVMVALPSCPSMCFCLWHVGIHVLQSCHVGCSHLGSCLSLFCSLSTTAMARDMKIL